MLQSNVFKLINIDASFGKKQLLFFTYQSHNTVRDGKHSEEQHCFDQIRKTGQLQIRISNVHNNFNFSVFVVIDHG